MAAAYHVIIADDDALIRSLIARIVARTYDSVMISAVPDGFDALGIYQQHGADLVITDQQMPVLTGLRLIERLRLLNPTLPVIMASAHQSIEARVRAMGVTYFLLKPFRVTQLTQLLTGVLPLSELEVDFVSDEHGSCHAGSHRGQWQPHLLCNDGTYKEL